MIKKLRRIVRHSLILRNFFNNEESKPVIPLALDLLKWTLINRGRILAFFIIGLDKQSRKMSDYLNFRSFNGYYNSFFPKYYLSILEDKLVFEKFINNFPEHAPKTLGYITKVYLCMHGKKPEPIQNIINYQLKCIVKDTLGFGGSNIFKLSVNSGELFINGNKSTLDDMIKRIKGKAILQEVLEQHETIKRIYPSSINTSRVVTISTGKEIHLFSVVMRIGSGGSIVDNFAKGNIVVPVNKETGKLLHFGFSQREPLIQLSHPQTGVAFDGIEIPNYTEAIELCKKLHLYLPYFFILGWDVAFTPKGPVIIESNNIHKIVEEQINEGGLKKQFHTYAKEFLEFHNAIK